MRLNRLVLLTLCTLVLTFVSIHHTSAQFTSSLKPRSVISLNNNNDADVVGAGVDVEPRSVLGKRRGKRPIKFRITKHPSPLSMSDIYRPSRKLVALALSDADSNARWLRTNYLKKRSFPLAAAMSDLPLYAIMGKKWTQLASDSDADFSLVRPWIANGSLKRGSQLAMSDLANDKKGRSKQTPLAAMNDDLVRQKALPKLPSRLALSDDNEQRSSRGRKNKHRGHRRRFLRRQQQLQQQVTEQ